MQVSCPQLARVMGSSVHARTSAKLLVLLLVCCALALLGARGAAAETVSFTTAGCTAWTAPSGSHFRVQATGAEGAAGGTYIYPIVPEEVLNVGGAGGRADVVTGPLAGVAAGERLFVCVDVGGGAGGSSQGEQRCEEETGHAGCFLGGAGGGASGIGSGEDFGKPVLVAGGGGGGGALSPYGVGVPAYDGGAAGQPGEGGERQLREPYAAYDDYFGGGGGGASVSEAGTGGEQALDGTAGATGARAGAAGPGLGGAGGYGEYAGPCDSSPCEGAGGGGGGGGYYGGGGGSGAGIDGGGGGGGSSLVPEGGSVELAAASAEPQVQISYTPGPSPVSEAASAVQQSTATLNATVNPNGETVTDCHFEYGRTEAYGASTPCEPSPGSGSSAVAVHASLTNLKPASEYHFRVVATNAAATNYGGDESLETLPPAPAVTGVSPDAGFESGGTPVTITGSGFTSASAVRFGSVAATQFAVESATKLTAIAPPQAPATVDVSVTNPGGTSTTGAADQFTYVAPGHGPTVKSLSSKGGPAAGGTRVTIEGTSFVGATAVKFGAANASFEVDSATSITAESPPGTTGTVEVTVATPNGESGGTRKARFKYAAPTVTKDYPRNGPMTGGTRVTIGGSGFALGSATSFDFGKTPATSVDCTSTSACTVTTPASAKKAVVEVIAHVGKAKSKRRGAIDDFSYE